MTIQRNRVMSQREKIQKNKEKRKRKRIIAVSILAALILAAVIVFLVTRPSKYQTGKEWFAKQQYYVDNLTTIVKDTDNVVALYLDGDIEATDVATHMVIFNQEILILKYDYSKYYKEHPLKVGTSDYYESKGIEAAFNCLILYEQLLDTMEKTYQDKDKLAYIYLAYQQKFNESVTIYGYCKEVVFGDSVDSVRPENTDESSTEGNIIDTEKAREG